MNFFSNRLLLFCLSLASGISQDNYCLNFPLELGKTWQYISEDYPFTQTAVVSDTMRINNTLYYKYGLYGEENLYSQYWLRPGSNAILALNPTDSSEYTLFGFNYDGAASWEIPPVIVPPSEQPYNQCDWGFTINPMNTYPTITGPNRTYHLTHGFSHSNHPCVDAGISTTHFSRDFGIVQFSQITEGGVLDWYLEIPDPDTISISGILSAAGNPCLTVPCLPGIAATLETPDTACFLTHEDIFYRDFTLNGEGLVAYPGDSILVYGFTTQRHDVFGEAYQTLEILGFEHAQASGVFPEKAKEQPHNPFLLQNFPNPFNPVTRIEYYLSSSTDVRLSLLDLHGKEIEVLVDQSHSAGLHSQFWDGLSHVGQPVAGGVYFVRLDTPERFAIMKILLLK